MSPPESYRFITAERTGKKNVLACHVPLGRNEQKRGVLFLDLGTVWTVLLKARQALSFGALELVGPVEAFGRVWEKASITQYWLQPILSIDDNDLNTREFKYSYINVPLHKNCRSCCIRGDLSEESVA